MVGQRIPFPDLHSSLLLSSAQTRPPIPDQPSLTTTKHQIAHDRGIKGKASCLIQPPHCLHRRRIRALHLFIPIAD